VQLVVYYSIVVLAQLYRLGIGLIDKHVSLEEQERGLKENFARVSLALQI